MATPETIAEQQALVGINADYKSKFGFHDPETGYAFKAPKGLSAELVGFASSSPAVADAAPANPPRRTRSAPRMKARRRRMLAIPTA